MKDFMAAHFTAIEKFESQDISVRMESILNFKEQYPTVRATASNIIAFVVQKVTGEKVMKHHLLEGKKFEGQKIFIKTALVNEFKQSYPHRKPSVINVVAFSVSKKIEIKEVA